VPLIIDVMSTSSILAWSVVAGSLLLLMAYEGRAYWIGQRHPERIARYADERLRLQWVAAVSSKPGFEIVALQALRNALMSATIFASTAALVLMSTVSLAGSSLAGKFVLGAPDELLHISLQTVLVMTLFASFVCSAMAMRHYGHATFIMSMPVSSPERAAFTGAAITHVHRAGFLYNLGLRLFLMVAPLVVGILHPLAMPVVTVMLLVVLHFFDKPVALQVE